MKVAVGVVLAFAIALPVGATEPTDLATLLGESPPNQAFDREMKLADASQDRDSRVEHLKKAMALRPDDPRNITVEFRIGVELSQRSDPKTKQGPKLSEALSVFAGITTKYRHSDYFSDRQQDAEGWPLFMVPRAAILAACLERGVNQDSERARTYLTLAMDEVKETYDRRIKAWMQEPTPILAPFMDGGERETSKLKSRVDMWKERQAMAAKGDVFNGIEMTFVKAAVRQYGYTFGRQKPEDVALVMQKLIKKYPNTPIATVAQGHIDRAGKMTEDKINKDASERIERMFAMPGMDEEPASLPSTQGAGARPASTTTSGAALVTPKNDGLVLWICLAASCAFLGTAVVVIRRCRRRRGSGKSDDTPLDG